MILKKPFKGSLFVFLLCSIFSIVSQTDLVPPNPVVDNCIGKKESEACEFYNNQGQKQEAKCQYKDNAKYTLYCTPTDEALSELGPGCSFMGGDKFNNLWPIISLSIGLIFALYFSRKKRNS